MPTLLAVTLNPAIDRTARVSRLELGVVLRPTTVAALAGGKGVNAARAARRLGAQVTTTGFAGGHAGRWLVASLREEGLDPRFVEVAPETRTTYVTVDEAGRSMLVYEPAAPLAPTDLVALLALLRGELLGAADRVVASGSVPPGLGDDAYVLVVRACHDAGRPCLVDVGGAVLRSALAARPDVVKISRDEAVDAGFEPIALAAARSIAAAGAGLAVVTDGRRGAAAATATDAWQVTVPGIRAVNAVGSGDAFDAGLSVALAGGGSIEEALAMGAAAGTANAETSTGGDITAERVREFGRSVRVMRVR
jgi:tagatose 6-phosphate kinase